MAGLDERLRLPLGLFPGAGIAPTPQELRAAAQQEGRAFRAEENRRAREHRDANSNRVTNTIFDFLKEDVGLPEQWAGRGSAIADLMPVVGDISGGEEAWQAFDAGNYGTAALLGVATGVGVIPGIGDVAGKAIRETARAVPASQLRAAARSGEEVAPIFRGLADLPEVRESFHADMLRGKEAQGPWGAAVDVRDNPDAYAGERMFSTTSGSRFSVSPSGEINSVVKQVDEPNAALANEALTTAKRHGGRWLSVFDTKIAEKYAQAGFRPVQRMKFSDEYKPPGWDYEKFSEFNEGRPDVVFMEYDPDYKGGYKAGTPEGEYVDDYDAATAELAGRAAAAEDPYTLGMRVLAGRAKHLETADLKKRPQPDPEMLQMLTTPEGYQRSYPKQETIPTPGRLPEGQAYPKGDRVRPFIDRQEEVAQKLAEGMRPGLGTSAEYFYHTGPILEAAERAGMSPQEAREMFNEFGAYYAATSPQTTTENNLRNATLARWKHRLGIPLTDTIGPVKTHRVKDKATGQMVEKELMGEKGYPMMVGEARPGQAAGVHRSRLEEIRTGVGLDMLKNTKPYTFERNVQGNLEGATVDTHAIRGAVKALNEIEPGSVPAGWLQKKYREGYLADPGSLDVATMLDDKLEVDDVLGQTEYGPLSDVYGRAASILGVPPGVAQSLGWFGSGGDTGLGSAAKTVAELLDERVAVTARELGMEPEEVLVKALRGQMPLLGLGGAGVLGLLNQMGDEDQKGGA